MESAAQNEYALFEQKVKRTVYIDNISPQVTDAVLKTALNQFGTVVSIHFIPNYVEPSKIPRCALVEMAKQSEAEAIISDMNNYPFMMSGMPRPARARPAEVEMFDDRPIKPGRRIQCRWLDKEDPDFEVAKKLKQLVRKHASEASFMLKNQLEEEEKLAKQQAEVLKTNYKKYEMIDSVLADGAARRLARHYNFNVSDD
ncbi:hypothetical protein PVL29_027245 [Vitis rotundifolia]|uniref:RRM domain-containing protein n=1 Tax=Vitis rotundifolia TaxID=103349 RepID=A0AA39D5X9_VITRO|nr:hypothetical protein PVL29_027245 [Vitis rotundifolia]